MSRQDSPISRQDPPLSRPGDAPPATPLTGVLATSVLPAGRLAENLRERGWSVGTAGGATSKESALDAVATALRFPAYFGRNLDALWDCLTDLTVPTALVWSGWEPVAVYAADDWAALVEVLRRRVTEPDEVPFSVVFVATPAA